MNTGSFLGQRLFGEYQITKKLGEGGMGSVFLARNETIQQDIAIKILHGRAAQSAEIVERFKREARVISMLTHPNIVRVFIFGRTEQNLIYMAMELVKGRSLREEMEIGMVDELTAIKIIKQCCSALAEAHDLGIIHRDLKPDNILLTEFRGEKSFVKVLDFGIAKITDSPDQQQLTQAGIVYGTPEYLSPEQAQAQPLDRRTDIYSLGVILYELMTGRVPFAAASAVQVLTMHVFEEPDPAESIAPGRISPTMAAILRKAMAKKPEDRFSRAMDLFRALEAREHEILSERHLDENASYVPGSELTGMFQAVPTVEQPALVRPSASLPPQPTFQPAMTVTTTQPVVSATGDKQRLLIMGLIGLLVLVLIFLIVVAITMNQ